VSLIVDDVTDSDNDEDTDSNHISSSLIVTGLSTENIDSSTISKASASTSNDRPLLDKLKRPTPADIARRRKVKSNCSPASNK